MRTNKLETGKILNLLVEFSVPAIIGMLVNAIYNIVDRMFIGNAPGLGSLGLAGITVSYPVTLILMALALMVGVGGATRFSISMGAKRSEEAKHYLGNGLMLAIICGGAMMLVGILFIEPILRVLGASEAVMPYAKEYLSIVLYGAIFQCMAMCLNNFSRADGNPKIAMISMLIGAGFNIVFDYILIIQFGMGMKGAALATIGGQFLSMVWQLNYFLGKRCNVRLEFKNMLLKVKYVKDIVLTGLPAFFMQLSNSILNIVLNGSLAAYGGDVAISTVGIITSCQTFILMPITGITQGAQPIISFNYGADKIDRMKEALKLACIGASIIAITGFIVIQLNPALIISMFNQEAEIMELGTNTMRIWFTLLPILGLQLICANYFQAIGKIKQASMLNLIRQVIFLIPLIIIFSSIMGLYGIFIAVPVSDGLAFTVTMICTRKELKRHSKVKVDELYVEETI